MHWRPCCSGIFTDNHRPPQCPRIEAASFIGEHMTFEQLKEKALTLPLAPGVYIMRDKGNTVIYVGKAKN